MTITMKRIWQPVTSEKLLEAGFTTDQILQLETLRSYYPLIEFVDSSRQWNRLLLLRWLVAHGKLGHDDC